MSLIVFLLVGLLVGWIASLITGAREGLLMDMVIGVVGSFVAGTVLEFIRTGTLDLTSSINGFHIESIIVSIIGAIALIFLVKAFRGGTSYNA